MLSDKEKVQIQKLYHTKNVSILPNCVDLTEAEKYKKVIDSNCLEILYLGRIEPNKGMDYLYEAMKELKEQNVRLHFAGIEQGANNYIGRFKDLLGDHFVYEGVVSGKQKAELLKRSHVFILPSLYEGLPMSLLECMSYGLVPVTTNVGSIGEYVENGTNGLLLKVKDSHSIIEALTLLLNDSALVLQLSEAARHTIFSRFNSTEYIEKLNTIYAQTF